MAKSQPPLFIGTSRFVAALDPATGAELWRTKLPHGTGGTPVSLLIKGRQLFAGCYGRVYCLDKQTGAILWENGLPKMGFYAVLMALEGADAGSSPEALIAAEQYRQQQEAAVMAATSATS